MKTSIAEIIRTEKFIVGELSNDEELLFEAKLLIDKDLRRNVSLQRLVHRLVRLYHRRKMKADIGRVHDKLFLNPAKVGFRRSVLKHFKF